MKSYQTEARSRWGATDAYREYEQKTKTYSGWTAQIIEHEIDHCNGILI